MRAGLQPQRQVQRGLKRAHLLQPSPTQPDPTQTPLHSAAMERWSEEGQEKKMTIECNNEGEVELYRHLLDFIHSIGKILPSGAAIQRLGGCNLEALGTDCAATLCKQRVRGLGTDCAALCPSSTRCDDAAPPTGAGTGAGSGGMRGGLPAGAAGAGAALASVRCASAAHDASCPAWRFCLVDAVPPAHLPTQPPNHLQALDLSAPACLALLSTLDTGASTHSAVQAVANKLLTAASNRLCSLLKQEAVWADADVQLGLLELLGALQDVLNDARLRRPLFEKLPFELLRVSGRGNSGGWAGGWVSEVLLFVACHFKDDANKALICELVAGLHLC